MDCDFESGELIERISSTHELSQAEASRVLSTILDAMVTPVKTGGAVTLPERRRQLRAG